ncbi:helix-turn-helix transcriptional regulator [Streptomyces sp. NPDC050560]|uniref:helix-turn-helix transcriptional regulator n=1 Tax=Streptomyces sp. NPDC050560 TaxID=3365630 RepID=UPI003798FAA4
MTTNEIPATQEWLNPKQVAELLGVSYSTLSYWRITDYGPVYTRMRPSRRSPVRYRRSDVEAWMKSNATVPASA